MWPLHIHSVHQGKICQRNVVSDLVFYIAQVRIFQFLHPLEPHSPIGQYTSIQSWCCLCFQYALELGRRLTFHQLQRCPQIQRLHESHLCLRLFQCHRRLPIQSLDQHFQ